MTINFIQIDAQSRQLINNCYVKESTEMSRIMTIGNATLDVIIAMPEFPVEDKKHLALGQRIQRGGNASNTSEVLAQLGHDVSLVAPLADDDASLTIRHSLERCGVDLRHCVIHQNAISPTSYIITNESSKSRTIIHVRDLSEFAIEDFEALPLQEYNLLHFEGRNIPAVKSMLQRARQLVPNGLISCEIEKPREGIKSLIQYADLVIFSNSYYHYTDSENIAAFFKSMRPFSETACFVCSRGSEGAYGQMPNQDIVHSPAFDFGELVDTVGAGDTFNAGLLASYSDSLPLEQVLRNACLLASKKVCQQGFDSLNSFDLLPLGVR